ncbi:MAG TPA: pyrroline-5-carboxylate reductase, partial [Clostridiaceae bacterium]|nr:pyrroline-5-carboxylate reductase [Clostridiaceae bacterium]
MGKNIGFIGCGNMGKAILRGLLEAQMVLPKEVMVSTKRGETSRLLADTFGVQVAKDNGQVAHFSQVLFLGVKPFQYEDVLREIRQELKEHTLIIGMAAGITLDKMEKILGSGHKLVKIMPNTPVMVKEGVTAMSCSNALTEEEKEVVRALLRPISTVVDIEEKHMDVITGIAG